MPPLITGGGPVIFFFTISFSAGSSEVMEFCLLQDVYPDWSKKGGPSFSAVGCIDTQSTKEARREQRKKAKRCKDPSLRFLEADGYAEPTDPDRPALVPQDEVLAMNSKTGATEGRPFGSEGFQNDRTPVVPGPNKLLNAKTPKYFGSDGDDDDTKEGFAPFTNIIGDDPAYRLQPSESEKELKKYLETPPMEDAWKPLTPAGAPTAFFQYLTAPPRQADKQQMPTDDLSKKLDQILLRLQDLEKVRSQDTPAEVILFVGSGLALLVALEVLARI